MRAVVAVLFFNISRAHGRPCLGMPWHATRRLTGWLACSNLIRRGGRRISLQERKVRRKIREEKEREECQTNSKTKGKQGDGGARGEKIKNNKHRNRENNCLKKLRARDGARNQYLTVPTFLFHFFHSPLSLASFPPTNCLVSLFALGRPPHSATPSIQPSAGVKRRRKDQEAQRSAKAP